MDLFEFEGKRLLSAYGIDIPEASMVVDKSNAPLQYPFVLKAQTLAGGRGKAGGIRLCRDETEFAKNCAEIMGIKVKGKQVCGIMAEHFTKAEKEMYLAITLQGSSMPRIIACGAGGMEIEQLAKTDPQKIYTAELDPFLGVSEEQIAEAASALGVEETEGFSQIIRNMQACFFESDALLVEINPLALVNGKFIALDAKIELDDKADFRHEELFRKIAEGRKVLKNYKEQQKDGTTITFVPLDGDIGLISDGAGTGMLTLDMVYDRGGELASFCELGGTTPASTMYKAIEYTMGTGKKLKSLLIVLIGGFNRMDDMANGIVSYINDCGLNVPIFVRMVGNMEKEGIEIMSNAGLKTYSDLTETVADAVAAAGG